MEVTVADRLTDISKRCGYSEEVVRAVLNAEADSIAVSLRKGERATIIGRVTIIPNVTAKLVPSLEGRLALINNTKYKADIQKSLQDKILSIDDITENILSGVYDIPMLGESQIKGLT